MKFGSCLWLENSCLLKLEKYLPSCWWLVVLFYLAVSFFWLLQADSCLSVLYRGHWVFHFFFCHTLFALPHPFFLLSLCATFEGSDCVQMPQVFLFLIVTTWFPLDCSSYPSDFTCGRSCPRRSLPAVSVSAPRLPGELLPPSAGVSRCLQFVTLWLFHQHSSPSLYLPPSCPHPHPPVSFDGFISYLVIHATSQFLKIKPFFFLL